MMISCENAGKVTVGGKFPCAVGRKGEGDNSILRQFCNCWVHKRCRGFRGKLKRESKFMSDIRKSAHRHSRGLPRHRIAILLKIMGKFYYLVDTIEASGNVVDSIITKIRSEWSKFRGLVNFLARTDLSIGARERRYSAIVRSVMLYRSETWPVKEEDVIRLEGNEWMQRWLDRCSILGLRIGFLEKNLGLH